LRKDNLFCPLRRIEIRFLPLDPLLAETFFGVLKQNFVLQELILADGALVHCMAQQFTDLYDALESNEMSSLTLLDLSRNSGPIEEDSEIHTELIKSLKTQKKRFKPDVDTVETHFDRTPL